MAVAPSTHVSVAIPFRGTLARAVRLPLTVSPHLSVPPPAHATRASRGQLLKRREYTAELLFLLGKLTLRLGDHLRLSLLDETRR